MKKLALLLCSALAFAFAPIQKGKYAHGTVFGNKPVYMQTVQAADLDSVLRNRTSASMTVKGKVLKVKKSKGGWFDIDAGNGKVVAAHFRNYNVNLPADLAGHTVIAEGVVQRPIKSTAMHNFAGDKTKQTQGRKKLVTKDAGSLMLVVRGVMVD